MLQEPWESEKVVLTGNLISPVGRSTRLFCLFGITPEFRLSSLGEFKCRDNRAFSLVLKKLLVSNTQLLCAFIVFVIT